MQDKIARLLAEMKMSMPLTPEDIRAIRELYTPFQEVEPYHNVGVYRNQAYGSHPRQQLDVFAPDGIAEPRPVLIFVHGGGFVGGEACRDPRGKCFSGGSSACLPGVDGVDWGGGGQVLSGHVGENPLVSRLPQRGRVLQAGGPERSDEYSTKSMVAINSCIGDDSRLRCVN